MEEEDKATAMSRMHEEFGKVWLCCLSYASRQTNKLTNSSQYFTPLPG